MAGKIIGQFVGKCCDANVINNNDMHLGKKLFENLFASEEYKRAMKNRHYIGFLGHPEQIDCMDYKDACIIMTDCQLLANGEVEGTFDLINTPVGRTVKSFIDAGVNFGISIRGAGDVDSQSGEVDPDTFIFRGFDLVTFPAYDDCIPEFKEVAASTDIEKQKKYKKVCAVVNAELKNITSSKALEVIREQFDEGSDQYNAVNNRINELECCDSSEMSDEEVTQDVLEQKVTALTQLYVEACSEIEQLREDIVSVTDKADREILTAKSRLSHYERIVSNQLLDADDSYNEQIVANAKLNKELRQVKGQLQAANRQIKSAQQLNLKYQRKIEAHSNIMTQKDSAVENFKSQLNETVVAKTQLESKVRKLSKDNQELKDRIEAAEKLLLEYQQAYANIYASALGKHVSNLTVDPVTSVQDLKKMIFASTNTSGLAASPMMNDLEEGDDFFEDDSLDDSVVENALDEHNPEDPYYSADLVTM